METTTANLGQEIASAPSVRAVPVETTVIGNPLRDEPDAVVVGAVKRFGLVGLIVCAVGAALGRWWRGVAP